MGHLEQFAKQVFEEETLAASHGALRWEVPAEMPLTEVRPDGLLRRLDPAACASLPLPWACAEGHPEVLVELKLAGDHLGPAMWQRALLRRQARQVLRTDPDPTVWGPQVPLWLVSPHLPEWVAHVLPPSALAAGVLRLDAGPFDLLWITANALPLREDLIPFLVARSGAALFEFGRWVALRRPADWVLRMLEVVPMSELQRDEVLRILPPTDDPEQIARRRSLLRSWLTIVDPAVRDEVLLEGKKLGLDEGEKLGLDKGKKLGLDEGEKLGLDKGEKLGLDKGLDQGRTQTLSHLFERKLGRSLTDAERATLVSRLATLGPDALGDLVLDLGRDQLEAWLASSG